jgi:hypothetical protein
MDQLIEEIKTNPNVFIYVSPAMQDTFNVVAAAVKRDGWLIEYASPTLQNNKVILDIAISGLDWLFRDSFMCFKTPSVYQHRLHKHYPINVRMRIVEAVYFTDIPIDLIIVASEKIYWSLITPSAGST